MSKTVTCPSGMIVTVRGMKAREMAVLQDRKLAKNGQLIDKLLAACIESTQDFGPYEVAPSGLVSLDDMLLGDKFFALINIRAQTFGSSITLNLDCANGDCGKPYDLAVNLDELPIKSLSPEAAQSFRTGTPLVCKVPSTGAAVRYRLAVGRDEKLAARARDDENPALAIVACRIVEIEGVETKEEFAARAVRLAQASGNADRVQKFSGIRGFLDDLPMGDFFALAEAMESQDCGVNTEIEAQCPECDHVQSERLQLGPNFWKPTKV